MAQVAEACCAGEPPAKRARGDEPDWTAKLNNAEKDYDEAKKKHDEKEQKLEAELRKENPQEKLIQFLQKTMEDAQTTMQNAQKRIDFAQQMLLQKQSQPPEVQQGPKYPVFPP